MRADKKSHLKPEKKTAPRSPKRVHMGYSKKTALLEEAITQMNAGKYGRSSTALKELLNLDPQNMEARRLFATLHLRLGSLIPARQAFDSLINEAVERQDYWLAESLLREYLAAGPRCVPFVEKLGSVFEEKGNALEAATEYGKAIDILLEDPDPDNPQRPSQLYAKIRELAPASPAAFRLASFFHAQTGELIKSPTQSPPEAPAFIAADVGAEETITPQDAMPWNKVGDPPEPAPISRAAELPMAPLAPEQPLGRSVVKAKPIDDHLLPASMAEGACADEPSAITRDDFARQPEPPREEIRNIDSTPALTPLAELEATIISMTDALPERDDRPPLSIGKTESHQSELQQPARLGVAPAPMPWDQIENTTIHIADAAPEPDLPPAESIPQAEPMAADVRAGTSSGQDSIALDQMPDRGTFVVDAASETERLAAESVIQTAMISSEVEPQARAASTPVSMPWDQVQDMTIHIVGPASKRAVLPQSIAEPEISLFSVQPTRVDAVSCDSPDERVQEAMIPVVPKPGNIAPQILPAEVPAATTSADSHATRDRERPLETTASEPVQDGRKDPPKRGGLSWQSISRAWKSGNPAPAEDPKPDTVVPESLYRHEQSFTADESGLPPAEATVQSLAVPMAVVPIDNDKSGGTLAVSVTEDPALPSDEDSLSTQSQGLVLDANALQIGDATTERASTLCGDADPVLPTQHEFRLQGAGETSGLPTDTASVSIFLEALDRSAGEVSLEADAKSGVLTPSQQTEPFPRDTENFQQDGLSGMPSGAASAAEVVMPPSSASIEPNLYTENHAIQPLLEESSAQGCSAVRAPETGREAQGDDRGPVASSLDPLMESPQAPPSNDGDRSHWQTGEVAVQVYRPAPNTRQNAGLSSAHRVKGPGVKSQDQPLPASTAAEPLEDQEEWIKTGSAIRSEPFPHMLTPATPIDVAEAVPQEAQTSSAAAATGYLFASTGNGSLIANKTHTAYPRHGRRRLRAKFARVRIGLSILIRSCFSTTRAMVLSALALVCLVGTLTALMLGAVGLTWMVMEESPSSAFRRFTTTPVRTLSDTKQNGYVLLLGFDAPARPVEVRQQGQAKADGIAMGCSDQDNEGLGRGQTDGSASVADRLFRARDPLGAIQSRRDTIKGWVGKSEQALARYRQWLNLPFEDWGYGQSVSLPCRAITFAHRVYVAESVVFGTDTGMTRLEADMEAWRTVLAQARTLPLKAVALQAVQDDAALASGFLMDPAFDVKQLGRVTTMLRPLDYEERSLRWPMQSELVWASQHADAQIKAEHGKVLPLPAATAAMLPLPKQRRLNQYAEYFETTSTMAEEHPYRAVPKRNQYVHAPPSSMMDYVRDPIENLLGVEPLSEWSRYTARLGDLDAKLRLVRLQAWLRRAPQDADLAGRIAKAGQGFYDPYTGLPMLINRKKAALYSVGHDGRDQDADPDMDIVVGIPAPTPSTEADPAFAMSW